ncbi:GNAT family N-acetyltransferase [bacterium]|nr:GNAT family N-acetyltransferase [bacterium]
MISLASFEDWREIQILERKCYREIDVFKSHQLKHLLRSKTCVSLVYRNSKMAIVANVIGLLRYFKIPSGRIYNIAVSPDFQKMGIGSELIKKIENFFVKSGMLKSCAEVRVSNLASSAMFIKSGYFPLKTLFNYYPDGEDGIKLWKTL